MIVINKYHILGITVKFVNEKITFAVQSTSYNVTSRKFTMYLNCTVYKALPYILKAS